MEVYDHRKLNDAIDLAAYILSLSEQTICDGFDERRNNKMKLNVDYEPFEEEHEHDEYIDRNYWKFSFGKTIVSVICHKNVIDNFVSYGNKEKPFELAIIIDDCVQEPIGYLTEKQVNDYLKEMENKYGI